MTTQKTHAVRENKQAGSRSALARAELDRRSSSGNKTSIFASTATATAAPRGGSDPAALTAAPSREKFPLSADYRRPAAAISILPSRWPLHQRARQ